jgi:putative PIN family toxin of toxin-antitoxin system
VKALRLKSGDEILDSSVLIAASISRAGVCAELLEDVLTHHELVVSDFIAEALGRKHREKFKFPQNQIRQLQRFLGKVATSVTPLELPTNVCRDPTDITVLGTALAGAASVLVALGEFQGIAIIKPGGFWRLTTG